MRKSNRRVLLIAVCFIMLFVLSTCAYARKPSKVKVRNAYKKYITSSGIARKSAKPVYIDFNRDGIQELFYFRNGERYAECVVCTYKKGKVKNAGFLEGLQWISYSTKKKQLCVVRRGAWSTTTTIYKLSGGVLKQVAFYPPYQAPAKYDKWKKIAQ